jgi:methyl-accepting chemotaxis protein
MNSSSLFDFRKALKKAEAVCLQAAGGDLEARITDIEGFDESRGLFVAINKLLDLTDAYVRESGASLEYASRGKYFRPFLLRGMLGDFRRGAQMINTAREAMERMEVEAKELRRRLADDFEASVATVVEAVTTAAAELEETAKEMSADAEVVHQQSLAVAAASEEATNNTQSVATSSEQLSASINEISRQVSDSATATRGVVAEVERANEAVLGLTDAARKIDKVVEFIREIAGQTNLLALNATIEAARAGDAGKGFAVVAHEVKTLASQTANATADIAAQIKAIQGASRLTASAIEGINTRTGQVNEVTTAIASAVEEQSAATTEISGGVQQAAAGTQEVSRNIVRITEASEKTGTAAREMLGAAGALSQQANAVTNQVNEFLEHIRSA